MTQRYLLPQFLKFDCLDLYTSRAILCEGRRFWIELKDFDPFNRDYRYKNKARKNSPGVYPSKPVFDKRIFDVVFKICANNKEDLEYGICEVEKVLQPVKRNGRVNGMRREMSFCMPSGKRYRGDAIVTDINFLNHGEYACCADYQASFQLGDPACQNPGCRTEIDKNGGDVVQLFEDKCTDAGYIDGNNYGTNFPQRIDNIVGDWVTQTQVQNFSDPFFGARFFQNACAFCYDGKSCADLSFRLEAKTEGSGPITFFVFCSDGEVQTFSFDVGTFQTGTVFSLNSSAGTFTQLTFPPSGPVLENVIPQVDPSYAEFPCVCPMKKFDVDFGPYTLDGVANYLVAIDSDAEFLMSFVYIENRC